MKKKENKIIACLGLSANPPHVGHLYAARQILKKGYADEVWLIPCNQHNFKRGLWPKKYRWRMTKLMEEKGIKASDIELKRGGVSYTIDTVRELKEKYPSYTFVWVLGSDIVAYESYLRWHNWRALCGRITFFVIRRPGFPVPNAPKLPRCFHVTSIRAPNISSTEVRGRLKQKQSIKNLVTAETEKYIKRNYPNIVRNHMFGGSTSKH